MDDFKCTGTCQLGARSDESNENLVLWTFVNKWLRKIKMTFIMKRPQGQIKKNNTGLDRERGAAAAAAVVGNVIFNWKFGRWSRTKMATASSTDSISDTFHPSHLPLPTQERKEKKLSTFDRFRVPAISDSCPRGRVGNEMWQASTTLPF